MSGEALLTHVRAFLAEHVRTDETLCLGLSGGLDSMVLLDVLARVREPDRPRISAVHVNHGLSPNAPAWAQFCAEQCERRGIALRIERVSVGSTHGLGLEAAARQARYAAFARQDANHIVLAHHRDDQAETLLLRLLRGAGVRGLSGMRAVQHLTVPLVANTTHRITLLRPFLMTSRAILSEYATQQRLQWCTDESNSNLDLDRNFLRHEILPRLGARFPHYASSFARAAQHLAQTHELIEEWSAADRAACAADERLRLAPLRALPRARAVQVVRGYVRSRAGIALSAAQTDELLRQLTQAHAGAQVDFRAAGLALRVWRDEAVLLTGADAGIAAATLCVPWHGETALTLPAPFGSVSFARERGAGVSAAQLSGRRVSLRSRSGGERVRLARGRPTRTLKNLLQEAHMPSWQRKRLPLMFCDEQLVCVPGIGVAAEFQAQPGEEGIVVVWQHATR